MMSYRRQSGFNLGPVALLIITNLIMFIARVVRPDFIISQFALQPASLATHPWAILSNIFIHADFGHILTNMLTLYFFGTYLIQLIGERKFLTVYFLGGLAGNILYVLLVYLLQESPYIPAVGASGAIFAVGGALTVLRPNLPVFIFPLPIPVALWIAVIGGFVLISFMPGVAWQAHLGGLVLGMVLALYFRGRGRSASNYLRDLDEKARIWRQQR